VSARAVDLAGRPGAVASRSPALARADVASDPYGEATAEFYELLATAHWDELGVLLRRLLAGVDPSAGPLLDIGAGTGVGLRHLRRAVPGARIVAVEPSTAMRTALHTRLAIDDELRGVVTVVPAAIEHAELPPRLSAAVASAVLGHLDDAGRHRLWAMLATRLVPGAPAVIGVLPPTRPERVPPTRYRSLPVGELVYEGWMEAAVIGDRRMRWTMTYRVLDGGRLVAERRASSTWTTLDADDVAAEAEPFGLRAERAVDEYVVLRQP
jgi:SAM-dependent methyltransferase